MSFLPPILREYLLVELNLGSQKDSNMSHTPIFLPNVLLIYVRVHSDL